MKLKNDKLEFSISDIVRYFKSPYSSWATWANLVSPGHIFVENDMVQNSSLLVRSEENENSAKSFLINKYSQVKTINNPLDELEESKTLIKDKVEVIVQPSFKRDQFIGRADFLIFDKDQNLFEVMDAKLAKQVKPEFLLQVCGYSWMLASDEYQGDLPKYGWFYLGDGKNVNFKLSEYYKFFIDLKEEFLEAVGSYTFDTIPVPKKWENFEEFSESADKYWNDNKKLELIADISSRQIEILERNGYTKIDQIPTIKEQSFSKLSNETLDKIKRQANAQLISTDTDTHVELRNEEESIHQLHSLLPEEQPGDIYFDLEGYPFADITSEYTMEYLYGVVYKDENGKLCFKDDLWADNDAEEKIIFSKFVNWVEERIKKYPNLRIYHYAHYEKTSLLKSAQKFGIHEIEIDKWLNEKRLVDLYQVVRKSFIIGKNSYSLKRIEEVAGYTRELDLNSGIDSIYYFERYLNSSDFSLKNKLKEEILMYNKDDCLATEVVCNWLRDQKKNYPYNFTVPEIEEKLPNESDLELLELETKINKLNIKKYDKKILEYISTISGYYRREDRVKWQEYFRLKSLPIDDKINDSSTFGLLNLVKQPEILNGKYFLTYECNDNTFKKVKLNDSIELFLNSSVFEEIKLSGVISEINIKPFTLTFSISENKLNDVLNSESISVLNNPTGLIHPYPKMFQGVATKSQERLIDICNYLIKYKELPSLVQNILENKPQDLLMETDLNDTKSEKIFRLAKNLKKNHLTIQGPPGTGKSTTMGEVIYKLFKEGKKIGIAAPSYFSALNLVKKVVPHLSEEEKVLFYHSSGSQDLIDALESTPNIEIYKSSKMSNTNRDNFNVIASYTHKFAQKEFENHFDYLVIDEVGQVPMATTLSLCHSTKNLLLIGDHNQLPQVINGSHPNNNNLSTMEYLIEGDETVSKDKGLFLGTTFRMHKDVNKFISKYFYNDLLRNHDITNSRTLNHLSTEIQPTGIQFIPVHHTGNTQSSIEEVEKVEEIINELLNSSVSIEWEERKLSEDDILIVSPYNSQVYELRKKLGEKFRVGTVDKFQGQEAPVVIVSLTASNYEEAPRGIDFILNFNRINVALSRSQCLSIVVGSPDLTHLHNQSLNSIRLTNLHRTIMSPN